MGALEQARVGRLHILDRMLEALAQPRTDISPYAPRILTIRVPVDKIRDIIGPGGKMIRSIVERTGCKIDVEDDGRVSIASVDESAARKAIAIIEELTATPELNKTYLGKVVRVVEFGAFVEILPGTDGLLHVSEMAHHRVNNVHDEVKEGDQVLVKVVSIDPSGKIRLSRKALLEEAEGGAPPEGGSGGEGGAARRRPGGGHGHDRGHDRGHGGGGGRDRDRRPGGGPGGVAAPRRDHGRGPVGCVRRRTALGFVLAAAAAAAAAAAPAGPAVEVRASKRGFEPSRVTLRKGETTRLVLVLVGRRALLRDRRPAHREAGRAGPADALRPDAGPAGVFPFYCCLESGAAAERQSAGRSRSSSRRPPPYCGRGRQGDRKVVPRPSAGVEVDAAVVPLDHHQHGREAEPGALALGLGGHEGLEEAAPDRSPGSPAPRRTPRSPRRRPGAGCRR